MKNLLLGMSIGLFLGVHMYKLGYIGMKFTQEVEVYDYLRGSVLTTRFQSEPKGSGYSYRYENKIFISRTNIMNIETIKSNELYIAKQFITIIKKEYKYGLLPRKHICRNN